MANARLAIGKIKLDLLHRQQGGQIFASVNAGTDKDLTACLGISQDRNVKLAPCNRGSKAVIGKIIGMKSAIVDGETIKENTWYKLENGEFVEVKKEDNKCD